MSLMICFCQLRISSDCGSLPAARASLHPACAGTVPATPQRCPGASSALGRPPCLEQPHSLSPEHAHAPSSQALAGNLPGYPRSEAECRKGAVIASTKLWGAGSCCLERPRRALSPSGPPQGPSLYLAKPGKVGGASAGPEMACHLEGPGSQGLGTESGDQDVPF